MGYCSGNIQVAAEDEVMIAALEACRAYIQGGEPYKSGAHADQMHEMEERKRAILKVIDEALK
jgi:hypothetical protein